MFALTVQHGVKSLRMFPPPFHETYGGINKKESPYLLSRKRKRRAHACYGNAARDEKPKNVQRMFPYALSERLWEDEKEKHSLAALRAEAGAVQ